MISSTTEKVRQASRWKLRLPICLSVAGLLVGLAVAESQRKNSAVVLSTRGAVTYKLGTDTQLSGPARVVKPLKSFESPGYFIVEPGSEIAFYHFPSQSRVRVRVPSNVKAIVLRLTTQSVESASPYVAIERRTELAELPDSGSFPAKIGAASSRTNGLTPAAPTGVLVQAAHPDRTEELYTSQSVAEFRIYDTGFSVQPNQPFLVRRWNEQVPGNWESCQATLISSATGLVFKPKMEIAPGQRVDFSTSPASQSPQIMIARLEEAEVEALQSMRERAETLEDRLDYLAALAERRLFVEAEAELEQLRLDHPDALDWSSFNSGLREIRTAPTNGY